MPTGSLWKLRLFGGITVCGNGATVDKFATRRSALLLARLALSRNGTRGRDELAECLWPDDFIDATRLRLRQELNRLRESLGPAAVILRSDRSWVHLDLESVEVDTREFGRLLQRAASAATFEERSALRLAALEQYSGPLLPSQSEDWVVAERIELQARYLSALMDQTRELLQAEQNQEAVSFALRGVRADPLHEPARRIAIEALVAMGDLGGALRQYQEFERAMFREFSVGPSDALKGYVEELRKPVEPAPTAQVAPSPKLESEASRAASLPLYFDDMIGRDTELALIESWLNAQPPVRLATVTGPGGVGKTRLAAAVARRLESTFQGQIVYLGLAEIEPGEKLLAKLLEAFGLQRDSGAEAIPGLGSQRCLLVFDNAEHMLEQVQRLAKEILVSHTGVSILVTSRQRLGIGGEQVLPLSPLPLPQFGEGAEGVEAAAASRLFLERARHVRPDYTVPQEQYESFVMLLERLDGLPLSIELAAARIAFLTPEQMLGEIDDRFTFLVSRRTDVGSRQRSLRATIDWSFRGLEENLREALAYLAMFRGGWTLRLAQAATGREDIADLLVDLGERSLIHTETTGADGRYSMLEAIRDYVIGEQSDDDLSRCRRAHASAVCEYVFDLSRRLTAQDQEKCFSALRAEMNNARAALDWAYANDLPIAGKLGAGLWRYWLGRGSFREGAQTLDRLLSRKPEDATIHWAESCLGRAVIAESLGDDRGACYWNEVAYQEYVRLDRPAGQNWALLNLSYALIQAGQTHRGIEVGLKAMSDPSKYNVAVLQIGLAMGLARLERYEEAMKAAEESFAALIGSEDAPIVGRAYCALATTYADCGKYDGVHGLLTEAVMRLRAVRVQDFLLAAIKALAEEELRLGNREEAARLIDEGMQMAEELGGFRELAEIHCLRGRMYALDGELAPSLREYEAAIRIAAEIDAVMPALRAARMAARDLVRLGKIEAAGVLIQHEIGLRQQIDCGLTKPQRIELDEVVTATGLPSQDESPRSPGELAAKMLAITAAVR